jgi:hypothetical protein
VVSALVSKVFLIDGGFLLTTVLDENAEYIALTSETVLVNGGGFLLTTGTVLDEYVEYNELASETEKYGRGANLTISLLALVSITSSDGSS